MHVALVTPWETKGGIATYSDRLASSLRDNDVTVTPVPIEHPGTANPRRFNRILERVPSDADVVHVQFEAGVFGRLGVSGVCAPFFFRQLDRGAVPVVTTLHEVHAEHGHLNPAADHLLRVRDTILERCALRASGYVVVHTAAAERTLETRHGTRRLVRLHHPVELDAEPLPQAEAKRRLGLGGPVFLTFGWVEPKKQYCDVVELLTEFQDATYLIAGEPRTEAGETALEEALSLAGDLDVDGRVRHLGYVDDSMVATVFSASDVVVLPYDRVSQSGVVNLALAYERPVVATALPAFEELDSEFGCLDTYTTRAELRDAVEAIRFDDAHRRRLERNARRYAETVTWDRFARKTLELYEQSTGDPGAQ